MYIEESGNLKQENNTLYSNRIGTAEGCRLLAKNSQSITEMPTLKRPSNLSSDMGYQGGKIMTGSPQPAMS